MNKSTQMEREMPDEKEEVNFNVIVQNQFNALVESRGISSELKMQNDGYQITVLVERMEDE